MTSQPIFPVATAARPLYLGIDVGGTGMKIGVVDDDGKTLGFAAIPEMKVPGRAWLQFEVEPESRGSVIRQTAIFDPAGLAGLLYWYALFPIHRWIFGGMLREIAAAAEREAKTVSHGA